MLKAFNEVGSKLHFKWMSLAVCTGEERWEPENQWGNLEQEPRFGALCLKVFSNLGNRGFATT